MQSDLKIIKEEHFWTSEEKIKFCGYGEWVEEMDFFHFEHLGYEACVLRILKKEPFAKVEAYFGGHLCGYVRIPKTHPYFGKEDIDLECHCGITFNEAHEEHWVGFDCGHSGDYIPTQEYMRKTDPELKKFEDTFSIPKEFKDFALFNPNYKNMDYCVEECLWMIKQLIELSVMQKNEKEEING